MIIDKKSFQDIVTGLNSKSKSKDEVNYFKLPWSISRIEEELLLHLSSLISASLYEDK